jgi:hypothetical protein
MLALCLDSASKLADTVKTEITDIAVTAIFVIGMRSISAVLVFVHWLHPQNPVRCRSKFSAEAQAPI